LKRRIDYALNWAQDYPLEIKETTTKITAKETDALKELIQALEVEEKEDQIQGAIFNIARKHEVQPRRFFQVLYTILLGVPQGPRLGPYIITMGRRNVIKALKRATKKEKHSPSS